MHLYTHEVGLSDLPYAQQHGITSLDQMPLWAQHVPYHQVVALIGDAWLSLLRSEGPLTPEECAMVNLDCDFVGELRPGSCEVRTGVHRVGTTSFVWQQELSQGGHAVARARTTMVYKDFAAMRSIPLTEAHRAALTAWLTEPG